MVMARLVALWCVLTFFLLATATAEAYVHETFKPRGASRGTILMIHGGAWYLVGAGAAESMHPDVLRLRHAGYTVVNVDYRPGKDSLTDVVADYDALVARGHKRICAYGTSAGGHLALELATFRRRLRCVIAHAAPTDLANVGADGNPGLQEHAINRLLLPYGGTSMWSPVTRAAKLRRDSLGQRRILLGSAICDPVVSVNQQRRLVKRLRTYRVPVIAREYPCDDAGAMLVHAKVSLADLRALHAEELTLLAAAFAR